MLSHAVGSTGFLKIGHRLLVLQTIERAPLKDFDNPVAKQLPIIVLLGVLHGSDQVLLVALSISPSGVEHGVHLVTVLAAT